MCKSHTKASGTLPFGLLFLLQKPCMGIKIRKTTPSNRKKTENVCWKLSKWTHRSSPLTMNALDLLIWMFNAPLFGLYPVYLYYFFFFISQKKKRFESQWKVRELNIEKLKMFTNRCSIFRSGPESIWELYRMCSVCFEFRFEKERFEGSWGYESGFIPFIKQMHYCASIQNGGFVSCHRKKWNRIDKRVSRTLQYCLKIIVCCCQCALYSPGIAIFSFSLMFVANFLLW